MTNLDAAFNYTIGNEGSRYTNDSDDRGGPTKYGITKKTYEHFFGHVVLDREIERMTPEIAKQIYAALYWAPLHCGEMKQLPFAMAIFDSGVLYGVGTIALMVQRTLSLCGAPLKLDGILGDKSLGFLNLMGGASGTRISFMNTFHGLLLERIEAVIVANHKDEKYRRGWTLRADRLLKLLDDEFLNQFQQPMERLT